MLTSVNSIGDYLRHLATTYDRDDVKISQVATGIAKTDDQRSPCTPISATIYDHIDDKL